MMAFLSQSPHFVAHNVLGLASPTRGLRNAGRHVSQFFLGRDRESTTTPIDISRSLRFDTPIPYSAIQDVSFINNLLPVEILGEIFQHYVFDVNPDPIIGYWRITAHAETSTSVISLCHVCSYWRALAISISKLWSSICVILPKMGYVHLVRIWLERSRSYPLSIDLAQFYFDDEGIAAMRKILELCIDNAPRWREVSFDLTYDLQDMFHCLKEDAIPHLVSFDIRSLSCWSKSRKEQLFNAFHRSPSLRRAAWCLFEDTLPKNVPWKQLAAVTLSCDADSEEFFAALSQCNALEVLDVNVRFVDTPSPGSPSVIILPNLFDLTLGMMSTQKLESLLDRLILPRLKIIDLQHGSGVFSPYGWTSLRNLLSRSSCQLSSFTCGGSDLDETEVISILTFSNLSSLLNLSLFIPVTDNIIHALRYNSISQGSTPLPLLRRLAFSNCITSDGILSSFICSRLSMLKSVKVCMCGPSTYSGDLDMIKTFQQENITVLVV